ncbi:hypothetical protein [Mucilaginibacter phyllosphaerae]|uniref:Uncharacterized protein n=1 Tax=Mucilaginibacter phyllosphaerae TaxID=1812349 RepID=A0A4Y8AIF9_9SPHI|nr:hypothetical protein [Mucilaginibacter phyllosphaerae]MBB3968125.1 hypothetical protein [Mucilaginibacter phyllosphaerae]TEW68857.1 hypothetical protein E2R65_01455 [Mucilaginibacter phyllosphaerae]GGH01092.1 hypothetical protein GCM10007352_02650 [Mucilaginibacter phyllosphaerae]
MQDPFDVLVNGIFYSVFPEEDNVYTIFKAGNEFGKIEKDTDNVWLKLNPETEIPMFDHDAEVDAIGQAITNYVPDEEDEEDEEFE